MNARQKAKFYKRKYEELLKSPVKFKVEQHKIDILRYERFISEDLMRYGDFDSYVFDRMEDSLREELIKHCNYDLVHIPEMHKYKFTAEIKLVNPGVQEELECILTK